MREETKAAFRLAVKRWFLRVARSIVWRADEWIHQQELSLRDIQGVGRDMPLQTAIARECPTATDETAQGKPDHPGFNPFPQMAMLAEDIGAETDSPSRAGRRQSRARAGCGPAVTHPARPEVSWAQIKQENARRRDSHRRPLWMVTGLLFATLLAGSAARADSITDLSGKIQEAPGNTITFTFNVQTILMPTFVEDILNGQVIWKDPAIGCHPCTTTYTNDLYLFGLNESTVLAEFGSPVNYALIGTARGVSLVDPPATATPEPASMLLLAAGIAMLLVMWPRRRLVR